MSEAEEIYVRDSGERLGRDKDPQFSNFQKEKSATVRLIRMACEILGPRGDQKNGCREQWKTFCEGSKIPSFKGNRFNCFFEAADVIIFHFQRLKLFFTSGILHENPNRKVQSVSLDIQDKSLMSFVSCLALMFLKITGPYWSLIKSKNVVYCDFYKHATSLQCHLEKWTIDPSEIFAKDFKSVFPDVPFSSIYFDAVHSFIEEHCDLRLMKEALKFLSKECLVVTKRQLSDFLNYDGKFVACDDLTRSQLSHCSLNNLIGESAFGDFDYDFGKRRNVSTFNRSAAHCLKRNKTTNYVSQKSPAIKRKLFCIARCTSPKLLRESKEAEELVKEKTREKFVENQQMKMDKAWKEIGKESDIRKAVEKHGGPCNSIQDLDNLVEGNNSKELKEILKAEIRYQKLVEGSLSLLISLSLGETLLLEPFDGKVYDLLPVFLPELWSCPSNHLCLAPIFWLVFLSLSFRLS